MWVASGALPRGNLHTTQPEDARGCLRISYYGGDTLKDAKETLYLAHDAEGAAS